MSYSAIQTPSTQSSPSSLGELEQSCYQAAIRYLSRRDHGLKELQEKLNLRGFSEEAIRAAISRCNALGYIDDRRYAEGVVRHCIYKGQGENKIRQTLKQKMLTEALILEVLLSAEIDWYQLAKNTALKKFKALGVGDLKEKSRQ